MLLLFFYFSFLYHSCNAELKGVIIVMRHGARSPIELFTVGGYANESYWPEGPGQLTKQGKLGIYELGKKIRTRYSNFIEPHSSPISKDIVALSSNYTRTLESAQILLSSLYSPGENQKWNSEINNWLPIAIVTVNVLRNCNKCPRYVKLAEPLYQEWGRSSLLPAIRAEISKFDFKNEISDNKKEAMLLEQVFIEENHGLNPPEWFGKFNKTDLLRLYAKMRMINSSGKSLLRMCTGLLMQDILSKLEQIVHERDASKIYLYSAHDGTILGLLHVFGIPTEMNPEFGSTFIIETHKHENGTNYLKVIFSPDASFSQEEKNIPNCGEVCTFDNLVDMVKPYIPEDWNVECYNSKISSGKGRNLSTATILSIFALLSIILVR